MTRPKPEVKAIPLPNNRVKLVATGFVTGRNFTAILEIRESRFSVESCNNHMINARDIEFACLKALNGRTAA